MRTFVVPVCVVLHGRCGGRHEGLVGTKVSVETAVPALVVAPTPTIGHTSSHGSFQYRRVGRRLRVPVWWTVIQESADGRQPLCHLVNKDLSQPPSLEANTVFHSNLSYYSRSNCVDAVQDSASVHIREAEGQPRQECCDTVDDGFIGIGGRVGERSAVDRAGRQLDILWQGAEHRTNFCHQYGVHVFVAA